MTSYPEKRVARHARALLFAQMFRDGHSRNAIARQQGCTPTRISQVMQAACPDFMPPAPVKPPVRRPWVASPVARGPAPRPGWSYPDAGTLALVRQIRGEMERDAGASWVADR